jgi:hypothetical protein
MILDVRAWVAPAPLQRLTHIGSLVGKDRAFGVCRFTAPQID